MVFPLRTPRVNNNDDAVKLSAIFLQPGSYVKQGDTVAEVETDKATFTVEAERSGYFLECRNSIGEMVEVGSILVWMGEQKDDAVPSESAAKTASSAEPTLKAALLLKQYGLSANEIPAAGDRLSGLEVEAYISARGLTRPPGPVASSSASVRHEAAPPDTAATREELNPLERGMLRTVIWHRDEAVTGYVEIAYDPAGWEAFGTQFQKEHNLLMNPMLSLMAYRLTALRARNAKTNATIHDGRKLIYQPVNVGFTVQSGDNLYLTVVAQADQMTPLQFVSRLLALQKAAMKNRLEASETSGATIGFTSMARWGVVRHQPILPPHTSLMIAHAAPQETGQGKVAALGATYDHRILSGADVVAALNFLKDPSDS